MSWWPSWVGCQLFQSIEQMSGHAQCAKAMLAPKPASPRHAVAVWMLVMNDAERCGYRHNLNPVSPLEV